ncbi:hypothetical protein CAEBREN_07859 [Caenorhabditis brenneri]|uniref:C2H2-type domain-containing protein n=1 Tax=Caenorhabditis brenneri TaxID=135651 RepID=G0NXY9_CAEBE|nr:hypothetical protein CAEBREN_07859 [Caenorhabditis brenneri]
MSDVITLSDDDDDIQILTPAPTVPLRLNSNANHIPMNQGATAHISTVTKLNLEDLGISKSLNLTTQTIQREHAHPSGGLGMRPQPQNVPQIQLQVPSRNGKRYIFLQSSSPGPALIIPTIPSTSIQRTRGSQNRESNSPKIYSGHYMFEATEGYEPSRRSSRIAKKIEGKFVCSYNPTTCYKLCGTVVGLINHVWSHLAYDPPVGPPTKQESLEDAIQSTLKKRDVIILAKDSTIALNKMRTCEFCNAKFVSLHRKQQHVSGCHLRDEIPATTCNICETDLETNLVFQSHSKKHAPGEAPYNCQKCKFRTSVRQYFFEHFVEKHCNEALLCPYCLYQEDLRPATRRSKHIFVRSFIEHMRTHATCKQFRCQYCVLTFNSQGELEHHASNDHTPLNPLWQVQERPILGRPKRERMLKRSKINVLQRKFFETTEGRRINDEVACEMNRERLGYDLSSFGNTLYECECGFSSWNGNRIASHFHYCRRNITTAEKEREVWRHQGDPKDELEMFAVYPQPTETEKETEVASLQKLNFDDDKLVTPDSEIPSFQPLDDLVLL